MRKGGTGIAAHERESCAQTFQFGAVTLQGLAQQRVDSSRIMSGEQTQAAIEPR